MNCRVDPNAERLCRKIFDGVQLDDYEIEIQANDGFHECNVRNRGGGLSHTVKILMRASARGSRFGSCTCGVHKTKSIPCVHMIAAVKTTQIEGLNSVNIMPGWCYTSIWKEQFVREPRCEQALILHT